MPHQVHFDPSVPTSGSKSTRIQKSLENQSFPALFRVENPNVPIFGYLYSMVRQLPTRRKKGESPPRTDWQVDVCVALPQDDSPRKGGGQL